MAIADTIATHLRVHGCEYSVHSCAAEEDAVRTELVYDGRQFLAAVLAADSALDLRELNAGRPLPLRPAGEAHARELFPNCAPDALPPLSEAYGVSAVVDPAVDEMVQVCFPAGDPGRVVCIRGADFRRLTADAPRCRVASGEGRTAESLVSLGGAELRRVVLSLDGLPPPPPLARELMALAAHPYRGAYHLARLLADEPAIAARIVRYAEHSPSRGRIDNLEQAIIRGLGLEQAQELALGLLLRRTLPLPPEGCLSGSSQLRRALLCGELVQALRGRIASAKQPPPGTGYLAALLHDIGLAVLAHRFPRSFARLQGELAAAPMAALDPAVQRLAEVGPGELGGWLLRAWHLPEEVVDAVTFQDRPRANDPERVFAGLLWLARRLLPDGGEAPDYGELAVVADGYGLSGADLAAAREAVMERAWLLARTDHDAAA